MRVSALDIWVDGTEQPHGILGERVAALNLSTTVGSCPAIVGALDPATAAYLRRLATEADKLADAIDARLAEKETARHDRAVEPADQPLAGSDQPTRPPYPPGDIGLTARLRLAEAAESTTGETRDVPTPGAAT